MKKFLIPICVISILISCGNKEVKKEVVVPVKKEEIVKKKEIVKEAPKPSLVFTVQIGANNKSSTIYASIKDINISKENGMFKYRLGAFNSYKEAKNFKRKITSKYPGAFVQALKDNKPIAIVKALK